MTQGIRALYCAFFSAALLSTVASAAELKVSSPTLKPNGKIPDENVFNGFGCSGKNVSPAIEWSAVPAGTKSIAVTVFDPDAPTGSGWWHWNVFNLPPETKKLEAGAGNPGGKLPKGAQQGRTDFGAPGYGGPCPPPGDKPHHYVFRVVALKAPITVDKDASPAMVSFYLNNNKLAEGTLTAIYSR